MTTPLVSIVIPCYNGETFVGEAIQSALDQTYQNVGVIVIDDGSTDGSLEVIRSFGDAIRWETGPNRGACAARNRGVELACGELIQFLDADDLLLPQKLERQVEFALKSAPALTFCDYDILHTWGERQQRRLKFADEDSVVVALLDNLAISSPLHRKDQLTAVGGFREHLPCTQEWDLHLRLACNGVGFVRFPENLLTIRRRHGSLGSDVQGHLDQGEDILWNAYRGLEQKGQLTSQRREAFAGCMAMVARRYFGRGQRENAFRSFSVAREMHPDGGLSIAYRTWLGRKSHNILGPRITNCFDYLWRQTLRLSPRRVCRKTVREIRRGRHSRCL